MALQIAQILAQASDDLYFEKAKISKRVDKGKKIAFRLYTTTALHEVMVKISMHWKIPLENLQFVYLTIIITPHDTLKTINCRDGDTIHVRNTPYITPTSTLMSDFKHLVGSDYGADFTFKVGIKEVVEEHSNNTSNNKNKNKIEHKKMEIDSLDSEEKQEILYQEIPAHRCILRLRSEKFRGLFDCKQMIENSLGFVCIPHYSPKIFLYMLEYLYTDELASSLTNETDLWNLISLADEYLLPRLVKLCEIKLINLITLDNVYDLFSSSDQEKTEDLRSACKQFVTEHYSELQAQPNFSEISQRSPELFIGLIPTISSTVTADQI